MKENHQFNKAHLTYKLSKSEICSSCLPQENRLNMTL